jgi:hypothetical protein
MHHLLLLILHHLPLTELQLLLHTCNVLVQGRLEQSVPVYQEALQLWSGQQGVITFSLANALLQLNRWGTDRDMQLVHLA